jgi:flavin-dependent dehydrogenase
MATSSRMTSDVCVIGGGPAGSSTAQRLASFGYDVCLVERDIRPRSHLAASLPSSILPLLEVLGVRGIVESAGFLRPERIIVWWAEAAPTLRSQPGPPGFHVERGAFDRLLLQNAKANGVRILQPAQAKRPERLGDGRWRISLRHKGNLKEVVSRFVVDASGARSLLGSRRARVSAPLLAIYACLSGIDVAEIEGRVEAGEHEWFWYAPLTGGRAVAAVFMDPKRLSATRQVNIRATYEQLLGHFRLLGRRQCGNVENEVRVCDASSRYAEDSVGDGFVKVGDACFTLDPLSSQGVQSAIASALQAAIVVNTWARCPENSETAKTFYEERQKEKVQQHRGKTALFYRERAAVCDQPFWRLRGEAKAERKMPPFEEGRLEAACRIRFSNAVTIQSTPIIRDNIIVPALGVRHECLERPLAFLGEVLLVPLLCQIQSGQTPEAIVRMWSGQQPELPVELGWRIIHWLWHRRIVVRDDST